MESSKTGAVVVVGCGEALTVLVSLVLVLVVVTADGVGVGVSHIGNEFSGCSFVMVMYSSFSNTALKL